MAVTISDALQVKVSHKNKRVAGDTRSTTLLYRYSDRDLASPHHSTVPLRAYWQSLDARVARLARTLGGIWPARWLRGQLGTRSGLRFYLLTARITSTDRYRRLVERWDAGERELGNEVRKGPKLGDLPTCEDGAVMEA